MCGIFGMVMGRGKVITANQIGLAQMLMTELAVESEVRGRDATGICVLNKHGDYYLAKGPYSATDYTATIPWAEALGAIGRDTTVVLGHTRAVTQGNKKDNANNHPIVAGTVIGVHNGVIWNDKELAEKYELKRTGEVDSEIAFRLVERFDKPMLSVDNTRWVAEELEGSFALAWVDTRSPYVLNLVKGSNPIELAYIKSLDTLVFASAQYFIVNALSRLKTVSEFMSGNIDLDDVYYLTMEQGTIRRYDASLIIHDGLSTKAYTFQPAPYRPYSTSRSSTALLLPSPNGSMTSGGASCGVSATSSMSVKNGYIESVKDDFAESIEGLYDEGYLDGQVDGFEQGVRTGVVEGMHKGYELGIKEAFARFQREYGRFPMGDEICLQEELMELFSDEMIDDIADEIINKPKEGSAVS